MCQAQQEMLITGLGVNHVDEEEDGLRGGCDEEGEGEKFNVTPSSLTWKGE